MLPDKFHRIIFLFATVLIVVSLPLSRYFLSVAMLLLALNWVLELDFRRKLQQFLHSRSLQLLISLYLIHVLFLSNTTNFGYAFHDLRIKLPLLVLPLVYGTTKSLRRIEFKIVLQFFISAVLVSSIITAYVMLGFSDREIVDSRYASLFISHIRFALMVVLSIYTIVYLLWFSGFQLSLTEKSIYAFTLIWEVSFLLLLQSFTGIVIFLIILPPAILWWAFEQPDRRIFRSALVISLVLPILMAGYVFLSFQRYNQKNVPDRSDLPRKTINGNLYSHNLDVMEFENGQLVHIYVSREELRKEWNKRSHLDYDSLDRRGQKLETTILRYLTSLGLTKDSTGINQLTDEDIEMIERGYTNHIFGTKFSLYPRIYEFFWEIDQYRQSGNPSGHSLAQRFEYLKTGWRIVRNNFWLGVGTGDVDDAFDRQYEADDSPLRPEWRHRAHNQYLTFLITFGILGFIAFLIIIFLPPYLENRYGNFCFVVFFLTGILSMLNEDTLETHVGVSLFAFFYAFLLYSMPHQEDAADA